jgi:hypothetical protein
VEGPLADDAEAVRVVHVEQRAELAADRGERGDVGRVAGHAVHAVHGDHLGHPAGDRAQQLAQVLVVVGAEPLDGGAEAAGVHAAVVDGLVGLRVEEDVAVAGQDRQHRHVDVRDGRQHQRVGGVEQCGQPLLDLRIDGRVAEQARPAGVRAPAAHLGLDGRGDLGLEVEAEVVAGGEIGEPVVADPDATAVDLLDDRVVHGVAAAQPLQIRPATFPLHEIETGKRRERHVLPSNYFYLTGMVVLVLVLPSRMPISSAVTGLENR